MDAGVHVIVRGLVQGVGFRYFVFQRASRLGLRGRVKNLYNGDVEIVASGDRSLLEEFLKEVKVGPRAAQVTDMSIDWKQPEQNFRHFEIA